MMLFILSTISSRSIHEKCVRPTDAKILTDWRCVENFAFQIFMDYGFHAGISLLTLFDLLSFFLLFKWIIYQLKKMQTIHELI